ncbi:MAG: hypothetical protein L0216_11705, partial [Planctomycetales bacterium]|nr:hypothetical protein [Planctomycetales bacterium]
MRLRIRSKGRRFRFVRPLRAPAAAATPGGAWWLGVALATTLALGSGIVIAVPRARLLLDHRPGPGAPLPDLPLAPEPLESRWRREAREEASRASALESAAARTLARRLMGGRDARGDLDLVPAAAAARARAEALRRALLPDGR